MTDRNEMTVAELIARLEEMDPDAVVRIATQPNYPLQAYLYRVVEVDLADDEEEDGEEGTVVYLAEGDQHYSSPYLTGHATDACWGW
jgi:predicted DNA-binding transcriptional regulator YafY